jgi:hypothetical protein
MGMHAVRARPRPSALVSTLAISLKIVFRTYAFVTIVLGVVGLDLGSG